VILPVYNAENYITAAVDSVLQQTYAHYECIIINDGSTDGTAGKLHPYRHNKRVKLIERENKGLVRTLNEAVQLCEGTYIMRMDADDLSTPDRMAKQLAFLESNALDILGSGIRTFGGLYRFTRRYYTDDATIRFQLGFASCFAHPTLFCRREPLLQNPYDHRYEKIEDYELWTRLAKQGYKMGNCPDVLLHYRVHKNQITTASRNFQDQERIKIARHYSKWYHKTEEFDQALALLLSRSFQRFSSDNITILNEFYQYLKTNYGAYKPIIDYHFFLCFVHNYFQDSGSVEPLNDLSFVKKALVKTCNQNPYFKTLPVKLYRSIA
jgi:glycosyltransferase involved in cell wall biosynthesis